MGGDVDSLFSEGCLELDTEVTEEEVKSIILGLKNNKAAGLDNIINEYIKYTSNLLLPIYVKLFNRILNSGVVPSSWLNGWIVPIYKNKGDDTVPSNYRGITILSCFGKMFTA